MTYSTDIATKAYQQNIVIKIGSTYFGSYQPDSGLTIDSDKVGVVKSVNVNPTILDIRRVNTSISAFRFTLQDTSEAITQFIYNDEDLRMGDSVDLYVGRITGSSAFSGYQLVSSGKIRSMAKNPNSYTFVVSDILIDTQKPIFNDQTYITSDITDAASSITVNDSTAFAASGTIKIDNEFIAYTSNASNVLSGLTRASNGSSAAAHSSGAIVYESTQISGNPIDLILQILISGSGAVGAGAAYDVLGDGLAIDEDSVNITKFETIRDDFFSGVTYTFDMYNIVNALTFIENQLLLATGTRLFPSEGLISIGILDKAPGTINVTELDSSNTVTTPNYSVSTESITNQIRIRYGFNEGTREYEIDTLYTNSESITAFGEKPELIWSFAGVPNSTIGTTTMDALANRMLARLGTPRTFITSRNHMNVSLEEPSDIVRIDNANLPATDTNALGLDTLVEVMSKSVNFDTGETIYNLEFTSFSGIRSGLIAPSPLISSVTSQSVFDVPDGGCFQAGFYLRLWNDSTSSYYADAAIEIQSVSGNTITMASSFTTTLTTSVRIKIADYDAGSENVKAAYAFISPNTGTFVSDSKTAYKILF